MWKLARWLEDERPDQWQAVHYPGANIEDSMKKLAERRLADDGDFMARYEAATARGRQMAVAIVVAGAAFTALLAAVYVF